MKINLFSLASMREIRSCRSLALCSSSISPTVVTINVPPSLSATVKYKYYFLQLITLTL
jgi:hypothetical protein